MLAVVAQAASTQAVSEQAKAQAAATVAVSRAQSLATAQYRNQQQSAIALARLLMAQSQLNVDTSPQMNTLLAVEAVSRTVKLGREEAIRANQILAQALSKVGGRVVYRSSAEKLEDAGVKPNLNRLAISPNGSVMAIADGSAIHLFRPPDFTHAIGVLNGHSKTVNWVLYSPDGKWIASTGDDQSILLWRVTNGGDAPTPIRLKTNDRAVEALAFDATGQRLAASYSKGKPYISIWRITPTDNVDAPTDISFDLQNSSNEQRNAFDHEKFPAIAFDSVKNRLAIAQAEYTYLIDLTNTDTLSSSVYLPLKGQAVDLFTCV